MSKVHRGVMSPINESVRHDRKMEEKESESKFTPPHDRNAQRGERGSLRSSGAPRMWSQGKVGSREFSWRSPGIQPTCHSLQD